jgi:hypothetical protein
MSRYENPCPACGAKIEAIQIPIPIGKEGFQCPDCHEYLKFTEPHSRIVWICSIVLSPLAAYVFVHNEFMMILAAVLGIPIFYLIIAALLALVGTPKLIRAQQGLRDVPVRDGDVSLQLKDKSPR